MLRQGVDSDDNKLIFLFLFIQNNDPIHVISISDDRRREKPPAYDQVTSLPPSYDEALKLDPAALLTQSNLFLPPQTSVTVVGATNNAFSLGSESSSSRPSSSSYPSNIIINKLATSTNDKTSDGAGKNEPPPYTIAPS